MPKSITQVKLRVLNLLCTDPASQPEMFKRIKLPNLEGLRLENEDFKQGWKLDIYLPILRQAPLLQFLTLSTYRSRIPLIGAPPRHGLKHRAVPDREMTRFLKAIPSVVCLRLPLAININAFVVEELARGCYIPLLETLELGSLHGEHIVEMIHRRNYLVENTLLCSPVLGETSAMGASGRHSSTEASTPIRRISRLNLSVEEDEQVLAYVHHSLRAYQGISSETIEVHITSHNPRLFYHPE
ncbi:hypothetical protein JR316_0000047 [Psilocybe cubensis]|uniref:Uncharacterized protein n=2 Tax=Psilocybe cubensis TaxID=181762 RepID=A0ACB8HE28_PSICU|nr:hypothetical protein JR316_0000047 [Psilocybe cubensis]KAH9485985.1 hypothetical protein JR316_0000047 [Psilocybe cubensis]